MSATRTWKCPQCGFSLEIGYDWLAEHGGPVCEHCDCDMDLQPAGADSEKLAAELLEIGKELLEWANTMGGWEAKCWTRLRTTINNAATMHKQADGSPETAASQEEIDRLVDKADAAGLEPEDLDEIVHEFAASIAADVNNGGLDDQIRYLVDGMGVQQTEQQLDELIEGQPREGE
jgi:hypothetical protein